jgi:hypothetical protein
MAGNPGFLELVDRVYAYKLSKGEALDETSMTHYVESSTDRALKVSATITAKTYAQGAKPKEVRTALLDEYRREIVAKVPRIDWNRVFVAHIPYELRKNQFVPEKSAFYVSGPSINFINDVLVLKSEEEEKLHRLEWNRWTGYYQARVDVDIDGYLPMPKEQFESVLLQQSNPVFELLMDVAYVIDTCKETDEFQKYIPQNKLGIICEARAVDHALYEGTVYDGRSIRQKGRYIGKLVKME